MEIHHAVRVIREYHGYSQYRLAQEMGYCRNNISRLEKGEVNPSWEMLVGLSRVFQIPLSVIIRVAEIYNDDDDAITLMLEQYRCCPVDGTEKS